MEKMAKKNYQHETSYLQAFFSSPCMASITSQFSIYHINAPGQVAFWDKYWWKFFSSIFETPSHLSGTRGGGPFSCLPHVNILILLPSIYKLHLTAAHNYLKLESLNLRRRKNFQTHWPPHDIIKLLFYYMNITKPTTSLGWKSLARLLNMFAIITESQCLQVNYIWDIEI